MIYCECKVYQYKCNILFLFSVPCNVAYVTFAIDQSESIEKKGTGNFERLKTFVKDLATSLYQRYPEIKYSLVSFSDQADILRYFSDFK